MTKICLLAILMIGLSSVARPATVYTVESETPGASGAEITEMTVEGTRMRIDSKGDRQVSMIFRAAEDEMVVVDHGEKSYMVIDREAVEALAGQLSAAMKQMEAALANVPPEQREMVEQMLEQQLGAQGVSTEPRPEPVVTDLGESDTVDGKRCDWKEVSRGGEVELKACVCDWGAVEGSDDLRAVYQEMTEFFEEVSDALAKVSGPIAEAFSIDESPMGHMYLSKGFPLLTESYDSGRLTRKTRFVSADRTSASDADFEPPTGYSRNQAFNAQ